ncbi:Chaperone protein DnaJ [subsurface metagenome]
MEPGSDVDEIKSAFRKSAKEVHPDINESDKAHQYFIILQNAYQYLLDHPYSKEDIDYYRKKVVVHTQARKSQDSYPFNFKGIKKNLAERYTLEEVLQKSLIARILYVVFHILFLTIGIFLIVRSISDIFLYEVDERTDFFSAYFVILSAIFFGILITSIFLYSGFNFIRGR